MLKKFFLNFLSSFVGAWVALGLFLITIVILVISLVVKAGISTASGNVETLKSHSVMTINMSGEIVERETPADVDYISIVSGDETPTSLETLTTAIREAAENDDIDMIYLKCGGVRAGSATLHSLREELKAFKKSGKKIYAYGDSYGNGDYYVASVADSIFINPAGMLNLTGMGSSTIYFKNLLDKLGIEVQVCKVGTFKSAVEPYISNEMSEPARAQLDTLLGNIWQVVRDEIGASRKLKAEQINKLVSENFVMLKPAKDLVKMKLIDKAVYERTMDSRISDAIGVDKEKLNYISAQGVAGQSDFSMGYSSKNQIAVLYACGEIMEGTKSGINCEVLVPVITDLADDDKVKGMVLRVNSPGGSVFGSKQIAEALAYFQSKGKPLAVSMGDYAASGGYWISCHADRIFADPTTITGSIGIFGLIPNVAGLAKNIGVTPQFVSTNPEANFPTFLKPLTDVQLAQMQNYINQGYSEFIKRVSTGRNISEARVRQIAEGRVWDGKMALDLGLVDELGQLEEATDWVQTQITKNDGKMCDIVSYPQLESSFWDVVRISMQSEVQISLIKEAMKLCPEKDYAIEVANVLRRRPAQARMMPVDVRLR